MADGVELGVGYVSVTPEWGAGAATKLAGSGKGIGAEAGGGILNGLKGALGPVALTGIGALAAGGIAAGFAAFKIGDSFDAEFDKIRVGTGKTGEELEGLKGSFKDVLKSTATDFDGAGNALTGVAQKLDLIGRPLGDRTKQFLDLSRITGTDLTQNLTAGTDALKAWNIEGKFQGAVLDELFRASQVSGASFADLASNISGNATVFKTLGFSIDDASTFLAGLAKGGIDANEVMPGLTRALATGAKQGKSAAKVYADLLDSIKDAPTDAAAASKAYEVLGARAGPKFAALVRSGKLSFDELAMSVVDGTDTINSAAQDTADFSEKFEILKNRVLVGLEPLASGVFDAIGNGMDRLVPVFDTVSNGITRVTTVFKTDGLEGLGNLIETEGPVIGQKLLDLGRKLYEWVQPQIEPLLGKAGELLGSLVMWVVGEGVPLLAEGVKVLIPAITEWLMGKDGKGGALEALLDKGERFMDSFVDWLTDTSDKGFAGALFKGGQEAGGALAEGISDGLQNSKFKIFGVKMSLGDLFPSIGLGSEIFSKLGHADGGRMAAGELGIVGEDGPELFKPDHGGTVIPHAQTMDLLAGSPAAAGPTLIVQQLPGENQIDAGMRALKWRDQTLALVESR